MITLVMIFCLSGQPADCTEVDRVVPGSLLGCPLEGQAIAQGWLASHPAYVMRRYACRFATRRERAA